MEVLNAKQVFKKDTSRSIDTPQESNLEIRSNSDSHKIV